MSTKSALRRSRCRLPRALCGSAGRAPVLHFAERILLRNEALGALDIAGRQHAGREPHVLVDDEAEIIQRGLFLEAECDAFLGLGLDALGKVEVDDIAGMLEIADIERDFERAARSSECQLVSASDRRDRTGLPSDTRLSLSSIDLSSLRVPMLSVRSAKRGFEHAVEHLAHAHGFERGIGERHRGRASDAGSR